MLEVQHLSTEAAARELRYQYFRRLIEEKKLNRIATGHTLDDQAETVLLRIVRGAGTRGMAGIYPQLRVHGSQFSVVRPLLQPGEGVLETYLAEIGQDWREDSSNRDLRHARNRVRHGIVPRLERTLNPRCGKRWRRPPTLRAPRKSTGRGKLNACCPKSGKRSGGPSNAGLAALPLALRRRVVRAAAESLGLRLEFRHVEEILGLARGGARPPRCRRDGLFPWTKADCNSIPPSPDGTNSDYRVRLVGAGRGRGSGSRDTV